MIKQEFSNPLRVQRGWREDGRLVGYIFSWMIFEDLHINNVAVDPEYRRRGIGEKLVDAVVSEAELRGGIRVMLEVRPSNAGAVRLYEKLSFKRITVRKGYYSDTGEDGFILIKELNPPVSSETPVTQSREDQK